MDQPEKELSFEESVKQVMAVLPPMIRDYLSAGKYTPVAQRLMEKYALRIDQGGVLEREIMLLIMGIEEPEEFIASLVSDADIAEETAGKIIADVNQEIFVPLREEMRNAVGAPKSPVQPAAAPVPAPLPEPVRSAPSPSIINLIPDGAKPVQAQAQPKPQAQLPARTTAVPTIAPLPPKMSLPGVPVALKPIARGVSPVNAINHPPLVPPAQSAPTAAPAPTSYVTDPYREPVE